MLVNQPLCNYVSDKLEVDQHKIFSRSNRPGILLVDPKICKDAMPYFSKLVKPIAFGKDPNPAYALVPPGYLTECPIIGVDMSCVVPVRKSLVPGMVGLRIHVCLSYRTSSLDELEVFESHTERGIAETIMDFWGYLNFDLDDGMELSLDADLSYACRLCNAGSWLSDVVVYPERTRLVETHARGDIWHQDDCEGEEPDIDPLPGTHSLMVYRPDDQGSDSQSDQGADTESDRTVAEAGQASLSHGAAEDTQMSDDGMAVETGPGAEGGLDTSMLDTADQMMDIDQ